MRVSIDSSDLSVQLDHVDDMDHFDVFAPAHMTATEIDRALTRAGAGDCTTVAAEQCWIDVSFVRAAAGRAADDTWDRRFGGMLAYAHTRGWLDRSGSRILAHIDRSAPDRGSSSTGPRVSDAPESGRTRTGS